MLHDTFWKKENIYRANQEINENGRSTYHFLAKYLKGILKEGRK
jgi:hypothetical protein